MGKRGQQSPQSPATRIAPLIDNSAQQIYSSSAKNDDDCNLKLEQFKRKALNPEDREVCEESQPEHFDFLRSNQLYEVVNGRSDALSCVEHVIKKGSKKPQTSEEKDDLPAMPVFDPTTNYYELYWEMYLRNEAVMAQISAESQERDDVLKMILMIEEFYNDTENLERSSRERYVSGRKKHHRRCANEI
jgi:hypothetical protein